MKNLFRILALALLIVACKEKTKEVSETTVDQVEETLEKSTDQEWTILFDGTSFDGWKEYGKEGVSDQWKIEDGAMVFNPPKPRVDGEHYNLISTRQFTNFELSMEWRIAEAGNSGIFWGVIDDPELKQPYESGPEIQVLDNDKHPDGKNGTSHQAGALYDLVSPTKDVTKPIGEWNSCQITINYKVNQGWVVLNGEKVVEFPLADEAWDAMVAKSKFAGWEHFGKHHTGSVGVQDHGDVVAFRNIKIREL